MNHHVFLYSCPFTYEELYFFFKFLSYNYKSNHIKIKYVIIKTFYKIFNKRKKWY